MVCDLIEDFRNSEQCTRAWTDRIWQRREEGEAAANIVRREAFDAKKALRLERDVPASLRMRRPKTRRAPRPVTASEVLRLLRAS